MDGRRHSGEKKNKKKVLKNVFRHFLDDVLTTLRMVQ